MQLKTYLVKNVENNRSYKEAMARSGPLDNTKVYHAESAMEAETAPIYSYDDAYWQEFMGVNGRREDRWRAPSVLAWNHKPYGVIGEVVNMSKI
jgi:hypothetical protein